MGVIVQKYGGTAVGTIEKMKRIADRVIKKRKRAMMW